MKRILFLVTFVCAAMFSACEYDDSALWGEIDGVKQELADHERRIAALEELCKQMNTNISALQTAVTALQNNDFVTNVAPITKDGETIGYTVTFSKSGSITIYNGEDGKDGADGEDAVAPVIGVKQDSDGVYYWTLDGEWLTDDAGNKIKAEGKDGKDGEDATDGEDGVTPQLKIENDYWYVSYDNGATWKRLGKATGDSSTNVTDCNCIIKDVRQDDDNVYFELTDGTIITIPKSNGDNNSGDDGDDGDTSANLPPSNEIWYTSTDGKIVKPNNSNAFGANIVSNIYVNGKGIITFDGNVTEIGLHAFSNCSSLIAITIPNSVTIIGYRAFYTCHSLENVVIPNSVTTIDDEAFCDCRTLTNVIIPNSVKSIGTQAFMYCYCITSITIPNNVSEIGDGALMGCKSLTALYGKFATADNRALVVDGELKAFAIGCGATSYTIPNSINRIGEGVFHLCNSIMDIIIQNGVTEIGEYAFCSCLSLTSVTIPDSVTTIRRKAFSSSMKIRNITIPNRVTAIEDETFEECQRLTNLVIGSGVKKIGYSAFKRCLYLNEIICKPNTPPAVSLNSGVWDAFKSIDSSAKIYVPIGSGAAYKAADGWKDYASMIEEKAM